MKENKEVKISFWASHLTTIVSVTLLLLLVGIIALVWIGAENETRRLRERIELSVVMADSVDNARAAAFARGLRAEPFAGTVKVVSKEQALKNWAADMGEDLERLYGVNPLSPEVVMTLKADWTAPAKIEAVKKKLSVRPGVESVGAPDTAMVESMNSNIARLSMILGFVAVVMIVISFVLINNTVQLTIYSRRFTIHTMQLVGATDGFIRRPVVMSNMACGLISGLLAAGVIAVSLASAGNSGFEDIASFITWPMYGCVAGALVLLGMLLCTLASAVAATRYLHKGYDDLFK